MADYLIRRMHENYPITCIVHGGLPDYLHSRLIITRLPALCTENYLVTCIVTEVFLITCIVHAKCPNTCIVHGGLPDYLHCLR